MFEALLGPEMPFAIRFFLAFLISFGLISATVGVATWAVRRFRTGRSGGASTRAREPRLAVIASTNVDEGRQLILVRRDNVEHLLMIGWRTNVIIEANIAHAGSAPHEVAAARSPAAAEPLPSGIPLPHKGSWPPQLEPIGAAHASRSESSRQTEPTATEATSTAEETLAALMDRIETALRKPNTALAARQSAAPARVPPSLEWVRATEAATTPSSAALVPRSNEPKPTPVDTKLNPDTALHDRPGEIASLLGRPTKH